MEGQLVPENDEVYVLCRSAGRKAKEQAMRWRWLRGLIGDLRALRRRVARGQLKNPDLVQQAIGRLSERHPQAWRWVTVAHAAAETGGPGAVSWTWDRAAFGRAVRTEGAYLLRAHWTKKDPANRWQTYVQLTDAEAAFRTLKSEIKVRPIWHWTESRVQAHLLVAFLGYCLWVYLKKCCERIAPSLTPWALLDQLDRIVLVEVWFELRKGGTICLPRITQPEPAQAALLTQLDWTLPAQPPSRVHAAQAPANAAAAG